MLHLSSVKGTEVNVSAEDLNTDPRRRNHPTAPESETDVNSDLPSTNLQDRTEQWSRNTNSLVSKTANDLDHDENYVHVLYFTHWRFNSPCLCLDPGKGL